MEYPLTMIHDTPYICLELEQLKCIAFAFGSGTYALLLFSAPVLERKGAVFTDDRNI